MFGLIRRAAAAATVLLVCVTTLAAIGAGPASAQDRRQNQPGQFDFYVLALSWSPSFCEASAERGRASHEQCGPRPFSFVVHGLWPQYERGFPEYCQNPAPRLDRNIVASMLDLMPARRLIFNEWDKHGVCTGLGPRGYFEAVRKARAGIKIPEPYMELLEPLTVTPGEVEDAFVEANPGMSLAGISVTCDSRRLHEVRICLTKDLRFRDCEQLERRSCRRERLVMPPVRGAASN
jgi:ribonuclease T2